MKKISKVLSPNDLGETGGHQSGILVPKAEDILSFFPKLSSEIKNPRAKLCFADDTGQEWFFTFIYYNNKYFGGTRNEYRLTGMTRYFRNNHLKPGDVLVLSSDSEYEYFVTYLRDEQEKSPCESIESERKKIIVSNNWISIKI